MNRCLGWKKITCAALLAASLALSSVEGGLGGSVAWAFVEKPGYVTGDEVNVRTGAGTTNGKICSLKLGHEVTILGEELAASNGATWYEIRFTLDGATKTGFIHSNYVRTVLPEVSADEDPAYEQYLELQQFPESYRVRLRALHKRHPKWTFVALPTGLSWKDVVNNESKIGENLVPKTSKTSWKSLEEGAYDWNAGSWIGMDGASWVSASRALIKHYLDPRSFLEESYRVLQFATLSYQEGEQTKEGLANVLRGSFMDTEEYYEIFLKAGKANGVNPYHLAARCRQEVGSQGSNSTKTEKDPAYAEFNGYYNFFNIGASPTAEHDSMYNGLSRAKKEGWDTPEKAILGGSAIVASKYVNVGQNTLYLEKFDVVDGGNGFYWHQYMTNLQAAASEAAIMKKAYSDFDEEAVTYHVPVYGDMPQLPCPEPSYDGSVQCVLKNVSLNGYSLKEEFDPYVFSYEIKGATALPDGSVVQAQAYAPGASVAVNRREDQGLLEVVCTGSDGASLTYRFGLDSSPELQRKPGDVNNDGRVDVKDAYLVLQSQVELITLDDLQQSYGDVNADGVVDVSDAMEIMRRL